MLESSGPSTSTMTTAQHQQMARQISPSTDFAEEYFASLSGPAKRLIEDVVAVKESYEDVWTGLENSEQEDILNESIIRPEAILRYEGHVTIRDSNKHPSAETAAVRLSSFGVDKVFPRLRVQSGQKELSYEDTSGSHSEDLGSDCTYSYRDEHSAPWTWMTRSQQELRFESGTAESSFTSEELVEQGLETLNASPSRVLQRQSLLIRQSKGNPLYAKPVGIPIVPELPANRNSSENSKENNLNKMENCYNKPPVSPHKINNFVYEEDNRIILDFGAPIDNGVEERTDSPSSESSKSSSGLLAKMKVTKANLKKSLSNVSNAGGTLRRKMSQKQICEISTQSSSPVSTLSSTTTSAMRSSMTSLASSTTTLTTKPIVKPSGAPPPPPVISKPQGPPPPPPSNMTQSLYIPKDNYDNKTSFKETEDDIVKPLEEFKIDLNTESEIPKTGFDFLDNW